MDNYKYCQNCEKIYYNFTLSIDDILKPYDKTNNPIYICYYCLDYKYNETKNIYEYQKDLKSLNYNLIKILKNIKDKYILNKYHINNYINNISNQN